MSFEDFKRRRDEMAKQHGHIKAIPEIRSMWPMESRGTMANHFAHSYKDGYNRGFTDPLVENMERALEELAAKYCDAKPGCKVQFAHDALDAYREAKAKVNGSGE